MDAPFWAKNDKALFMQNNFVLFQNFGMALLVGAPSDSSKGELDLVFKNCFELIIKFVKRGYFK